jgi:tRNA pseudouridine38-40 synthase
MVGTLVDVGLSKMSADDLADALSAADRKRCGPVAPPDGLYLMEVGY